LKVPSEFKTLGNVQVSFPGLEHGAGFVLFINDGLISMLEGYTYGEPWPEDITGYSFHPDEVN